MRSRIFVVLKACVLMSISFCSYAEELNAISDSNVLARCIGFYEFADSTQKFADKYGDSRINFRTSASLYKYALEVSLMEVEPDSYKRKELEDNLLGHYKEFWQGRLMKDELSRDFIAEEMVRCSFYSKHANEYLMKI